MLVTKPNRDKDFRCLTTACPDTCCAGWEIVVDGESAARFARLEGAMGERVRQSLITVDGEVQMARSADGRCLLLNEKKLCDLYALHGESALCQNCRQHPRFVADYGARREVMPGLSCPAWIETYLKDEEKVTFCTEETDEPIGYTDIDGALFFKLYRARAASLELLQDRRLSIDERMRCLLALAQELDGEEETDCPQTRILPDYRKKLLGLEVLTSQWQALLEEKVAVVPADAQCDLLWEKVLVYDVFRFFLRGVYDGRVLPWAKYAVFHVLILRYLTNGIAGKNNVCEVIRLYSKEIEHCAENQEKLHRTLCRRSGRWSVAGLVKAMEE